jgi:hypothetical protein
VSKMHYHGVFHISEKRYKILKRILPILKSPEFHMQVSIKPIADDEELELAVREFIVGALVAIEHVERIQ